MNDSTQIDAYDVDGFDKEELDTGESDEVRIEFTRDEGEIVEVRYKVEDMPKPATASVPSYR